MRLLLEASTSLSGSFASSSINHYLLARYDGVFFFIVIVGEKPQGDHCVAARAEEVGLTGGTHRGLRGFEADLASSALLLSLPPTFPRRRPDRQSAQIVEYGTFLLEKGYLQKLGDDLWSTLEQIAIAALDVGEWDLAEVRLLRKLAAYNGVTEADSLALLCAIAYSLAPPCRSSAWHD